MFTTHFLHYAVVFPPVPAATCMLYISFQIVSLPSGDPDNRCRVATLERRVHTI